jgi:hypothetical protein
VGREGRTERDEANTRPTPAAARFEGRDDDDDEMKIAGRRKMGWKIERTDEKVTGWRPVDGMYLMADFDERDQASDGIFRRHDRRFGRPSDRRTVVMSRVRIRCNVMEGVRAILAPVSQASRRQSKVLMEGTLGRTGVDG